MPVEAVETFSLLICFSVKATGLLQLLLLLLLLLPDRHGCTASPW